MRASLSRTAPHPPCNGLYLAPMLAGCCLVLATRWDAQFTPSGAKAIYISPNERASPGGLASPSGWHGWSAHDDAGAGAGAAVGSVVDGGEARRLHALPVTTHGGHNGQPGEGGCGGEHMKIQTGLEQMREKLQRMVDQGKFAEDEAMQIWTDAVEAAAGESQGGPERGAAESGPESDPSHTNPAADAVGSPEAAPMTTTTADPGSRRYSPAARSSQSAPPGPPGPATTGPAESPEQTGDIVRAGPYGAVL